MQDAVLFHPPKDTDAPLNQLVAMPCGRIVRMRRIIGTSTWVCDVWEPRTNHVTISTLDLGDTFWGRVGTCDWSESSYKLAYGLIWDAFKDVLWDRDVKWDRGEATFNAED